MTDIVLTSGDGIGAEASRAVERILEAAGAKLTIHRTKLGMEAFEAGYTDGIEPGTLETISEVGVALKPPTETPSGGGHRSLNVQMRQDLSLWANVRPAVSYPQLKSPNQALDLVVFRENSEGLYCGLTGNLDDDAKKLLEELHGTNFAPIVEKYDQNIGYATQIISAEASERIVRAAFKFAAHSQKSDVRALSKPNILKHTDGLFQQAFNKVQSRFEGQISSKFQIVDFGFADNIAFPKKDRIIVTENLYGDIISDVFVTLAHGSLGLAPSVNLGGTEESPIAVFEAVHGSAPDIAGQDKANPSALLLSSIMMLRYIGDDDAALLVHNALMKTWEDRHGTRDMNFHGNYQMDAYRDFISAYKESLGDSFSMDDIEPVRKAWDETVSRNKNVLLSGPPVKGTLTTTEFTNAVIRNLGEKPKSDFTPSYMSDDYGIILS